MESDILVLDECQRAIESLLLDVSLNKNTSSLETCRQVMNRLNPLLANINIDKDLLMNFAGYVLELYDKLKKKDSGILSIDDKLLWISSKVNGLVLSPLFLNQLFIDYENHFVEKLLPVPKDLNVLEWKRLNEISHISWNNEGIEDLYQDLAPNCSFVSSILSVSKNSNISLIRSVTPNRQSNKYGVKLFINGCHRLVILDDQVPITSDDNITLFVRSLSNHSLLWPALLEKAYFKVLRDGYDHQGSNFSIDTYMLTGWLLSYCYINDLSDSRIERYYQLFQNGNLVLGIGAGNLTKLESDFYGILPNHDYSIQDIIKNEDSSFTFIAKNPLLEKDDRNRVFKITNLNIFDILYININPKIYEFETSLNFLFKPPAMENDSSFASPQFCVTNKSGGPIDVILLLERHLIDNNFEQNSFINVNVYQSNGERIWGNNYLKIMKGVENNTRFHTSILRLSGEKCTVVISHRTNVERLQCFTLRAFSKSNFQMTKAKNKFNKYLEMEGQWDHTNSFGNPSYKNYVKNPQHALCLRSRDSKEVESSIALLSNSHLVNLDLHVKEDDAYKFLTTYVIKDLILHNTSYKDGKMIYTDLKLRTNTEYILVASTSDPIEFKLPYLLLINYDDPHDTISPTFIKIETNLGLFNKSLSFNWDSENKHRIGLNIDRKTLIQLRLTFSSNLYSEYRSKLRVSIIRINPNSSLAAVLINNNFVDEFYGIYIKQEIDAGSYILLVERLEVGNGGCELEIGANNKFVLTDNV